MLKNEMKMLLRKKRMQLDRVTDDLVTDHDNGQLKEQMLTLVAEIALLETDIQSYGQQLQEGWSNDQD